VQNYKFPVKRGKYFWDYLLFSEFSRDSTKKNAPFFVFAARKFANLGNYAYLCNVRKDYPGKFPERASRIRHYPFLKQAASFGVRFYF